MKTRRGFLKATLLTGAAVSFGSACRNIYGLTQGSRFRYQELRAKLKGRIILPGDADYDKVRRVSWFNPQTDKHPAVVAQCETSDDVARSIEFGRENGLQLAVRSGGHSFMGWGTGDGLVLDLTRMQEVSVDSVQRRIRVGAGVTAQTMARACAKYGLAPVLGECGSVGAGLGLGGGLGWLAGTYGATSDNMLGARLITAGMEQLTADSETNQDLFWAIRGGGGNFGVVTSFDYRIHPTRPVLAGGLTYKVADAPAMMRFFRDFMAAAPDELQALLYLTSSDGGVLLILLVCSGQLDEAEKLVEQIRRFKTPQRDWVERRAYEDTYTMPPYGGSEERSVESCAFHAIRGSYIERLTDDAIDVVIARFSEPPPACEIGFDLDHYMHGEVCRVPPESTAFELRTPGAVHLAFGAEWNGSERTAACEKWLNETWLQLQPYSGGRMYANYICVDGQASAKAAYGRNYPRLTAVKKRYDPENIFRRNLNVRAS